MNSESLIPAVVEAPTDPADLMTDAELDAAIDAELDRDEAAAIARLPVAPTGTAWMAFDPKGLRQPLRVEYRGQGRVEVTLGLVRSGVKLDDADKLVERVREQVAEAARSHHTVKLWIAAIAEKAKHERAARIARATAESAAAQRAELVAHGADGDLARQLRSLDEKATTARAAAAEAESLVCFATEAVAARRREAMTAVAEVYASVSMASAAGSTLAVDDLIQELVELVAPKLDEIVRAQLVRKSLANLHGVDRAPLAAQLLMKLEAEAVLAASKPARTSA